MAIRELIEFLTKYSADDELYYEFVDEDQQVTNISLGEFVRVRSGGYCILRFGKDW